MSVVDEPRLERGVAVLEPPVHVGFDDDEAAPEPTANELREYFSPARLTWGNIDWVVLGWIAAMHVGALFAPFYFTWSALAVALVLHYLTGSIGVCIGYHRTLSHRSLKLKAPARFFATFCGVLSGEGSPLTWSATHRVHHARSDQEGDPHSPNDGRWWSHMNWLFAKRTKAENDALHRHYCPDLLADPIMRFFEATYGPCLILLGLSLYLVGGLPWLLWGLCLRGCVTYHTTWFVNSATHLWGYRNYETRDQSRNLWWVALMSWGEGWHNNHHAHPRLARAGHKWWEFDVSYWLIKALRAVGQATDVKDRVPAASTAQA